MKGTPRLCFPNVYTEDKKRSLVISKLLRCLRHKWSNRYYLLTYLSIFDKKENF